MLTTTSAVPGVPGEAECGDLVDGPAAAATDTVAPKCMPWLRERAACSMPPCVQTAQSRSCASTLSAMCGSPPSNGPRNVTPSPAGEPSGTGRPKAGQSGRIARRPGEERVARVVRDERRLVLGDRLQRRRRARAEIRPERLDDRCAVGIGIRVERHLHEARAVGGHRLVVAATARVDVLHGLAVEPAEDVHEARAVLREERRSVGEHGRALDRSGGVRLRLDRAQSTKRRRRSRSAGRRPGRSGNRAGSRRSAAGRAGTRPRRGRPRRRPWRAHRCGRPRSCRRWTTP